MSGRFTLIHKSSGRKFYIDENTDFLSYDEDKFTKVESLSYAGKQLMLDILSSRQKTPLA